MASFVYEVAGPTGFALGFVICEVICLLSLAIQEGLKMIEKVCIGRVSSMACVLEWIIVSAERHLPHPYRHR